nr:leucine-rich repeat domain-containing protein [Lachnospiraceae bacterium]
ALDGGYGYYTEANQTAMAKSFANLEKFSNEGYGVVLGEHGVCNPAGVSGSVTQWLYDVFGNCQKYHAVPCLWETSNYFDRKACQLAYSDIAVLYNTVNQADGDATAERESGGAEPPESIDKSVIKEYLDKEIWGQEGTIKAYIFYQTPTWDYRDEYVPTYKLGLEQNSWNYIKVKGTEVTADSIKVVDATITGDGEYTLSYDGINLSAANHFNILGISTNIDISKYGDTGIEVSDVHVSYDGQEIGDGGYDTKVMPEEEYMNFLLIDKWFNETYAMTDIDLSGKYKLPSKSLEISFKITGLDAVLQDIEDLTYVEPETGIALDGSTPAPEEEETETPKQIEPIETNPVATSAPAADATSAPASKSAATLAPSGAKPATKAAATASATTAQSVSVGDTIESGNFKYKVLASNKLSVVGLTASGKKAAKLNVKAKVNYNSADYNVTKLANKAFANAKAKTVILNKNIKKIPKLCFNNCKKLSVLKLCTALKSAQKNAFKGCKKKIKVKGTAAKKNKKILKKCYKKIK